MSEPFDTPPPDARLSAAEMEEADDLLVALAFGPARDKAGAAQALQRWAGKDPARLRYIDAQQSADERIDENLVALRQRYPRPAGRAAAPAGRPGKRWLRWTCAAGGFAGGLAAVLFVVNPVLSSQEFHAATGELASITLEDGSRVLLNTASSVVFDSRLRTRELTLAKGDAMFTVADGSWRPFQVTAQSATIRDIGTVFSVRHDGQNVAVAVLEGAVEISIPSAKAPLLVTARQAATAYGGMNPQVLPSQDFDALVSWRDRRLEFTSEPLRSLIAEVQRYRKQPIRFADRHAETVRVTGGFSSADPDLLLKTLPAVAPVDVAFGRDGEAVISSRN